MRTGYPLLKRFGVLLALLFMSLSAHAEQEKETEEDAESSLCPAQEQTADASQTDSSCFLFHLVYLQPESNSENDNGLSGGLGVTYDLQYSLWDTGSLNSAGESGVDKKDGITRFHKYHLEFHANGTYAFDQDTPRKDFIKAKVDGLYQWYREDKQFVDRSLCLSPDDITSGRCQVTLDSLFIDAGLTASYESDQRRENVNYTYGATARVSWWPDRDSAVLKFNPLDWPFRMIRKATGDDPRPIRQSMPSLLLNLERISPDKDTLRQEVLDASSEDYDRLNIELGFSTAVGMFSEKRVNFSASLRYFRELDPPTAIEAADMDTHKAVFYSLEMDSGWRLTYATGKLPFDREEDQLWELGYQLDY